MSDIVGMEHGSLRRSYHRRTSVAAHADGRRVRRRNIKAAATSAAPRVGWIERLEDRLLLSDTTPPTAAVEQPTAPVNFGDSSYTFTMLYTDNVAIDTSLLGDSNIEVVTPNRGTLPAFFLGFTGSGGTIHARYQFNAPDETFTKATDLGQYNIFIEQYFPGSSGIADTSGNAIPMGAISGFNLAFRDQADNAPPAGYVDRAQSAAVNMSSSYTFFIDYTDDRKIDASTLGNDDLLVTSSSNFSQNATFLGVVSDHGDTLRAEYSITGAGGTITSMDVGTYTVQALSHFEATPTSGVGDFGRNFLPNGPIGTFFLGFTSAGGADTVPPVAMVDRAQAIPIVGTSSYRFAVIYADDVSVATSTIDNNDVTVMSPGGFNQTAHLVSTSLTDDSFVRAVYEFSPTPPASSFTAGDSGTYNVAMVGSAVTDTSGNFVPAGPIGPLMLNFISAPTPTPTPTPTPVPPSGNGFPVDITDYSYASGRYSPGGAISLRLTLQDVVGTPVAPFTVNVGLSLDPNFSAGAVVLLTSVPVTQTLAPGQSVQLRINVPIPANIPAGSYYGGVQIVLGSSADGAILEKGFNADSPDIIISAPPPPPMRANIGGLDATFGVNGVVRQRTGLTTTVAVAQQADGKTIAVGNADGMGGNDFGVTRFNADGSIDTTFAANSGSPGTAFMDFNGTDDQPIALRLQPDGKILVAGTSTDPAHPGNSDFALARLNTDGTPDMGFGNGGETRTNLSVPPTPSADVAGDLLLVPDGRIFITGTSDGAGRGNDFAIARYNPNGQLDTAFNGTGYVLTDFSGGDDNANAITTDPRNGGILVAGSTSDAAGATTKFALVRYNVDGSLDPTFGSGGKVVTSVLGSDDEAFAIALTTKGQVIAAGSAVTGASSNFAVVRYTSKGVPDRTFGTNGIVTTNFSQPAVANQIKVSDDGSLLVAGATAASLASIDVTHLDVALAQYTAAGAPDTGFGTNGTTVLTLGTSTSSAPGSGGAADVGATSSQVKAALAALSKQKAIADALSGRFIVVATSGTDTVAAQIVSSGADLTDAITAGFAAASVLAGAKGSATVTITDAGNRAASGSVTIKIYASLDGTLDTGDVALSTLTKGVKLNANASKAFKAKVLLPKTLPDGSYYMIVQVDGGTSLTEVSSTNNTAASSNAVAVAGAYTDLTAAAPTTPSGLATGGSTVVNLTVTNSGNVQAKGTLAVELLAAAGSTPADSDPAIGTAPKLKVNLKPGASTTYKVPLSLPASVTAGTYTFLAVLTPKLSLQDMNATNNIIEGTSALVVT